MYICLLKNRKYIFILAALILASSITFAAEKGPFLQPIHRKKQKLSWIFGLGWNAVDDNGSPFKKLFAAREAWNLPWYPSAMNAEILGEHGLSYGLAFNFNRYKAGKIINSIPSPGRFFFLSWDYFTKYHFKKHIKMDPRYDPYFSMGAGYTLRFIKPYNSTFTFNTGFGINIWMSDKIGLNLQSLAKFGLRSPFFRNGSNYLHHSIGFVYIWDRSPRKQYSFIKPRYKWVHDNRGMNERRR